MPVTAASFNILNNSQQFNNQLSTAITYLTQDPQIAEKMQDVIDQAAGMGKQVIMIDSSNPNAIQWMDKKDLGQDLFGHMPDGTPVVMLNLNAACAVWQTDEKTGQNTLTGIQSAADALYHELVGHGSNPNDDTQSGVSDPQYERANERAAVSAEAAANSLLGEPTRNNHDGVDIPVNDPTLHTVDTGNGQLQLVWMGKDGKTVYGPEFSPGNPQWGNLKAFGTQLKTAIDATGADINHQDQGNPDQGGGGSGNDSGDQGNPDTGNGGANGSSDGGSGSGGGGDPGLPGDEGGGAGGDNDDPDHQGGPAWLPDQPTDIHDLIAHKHPVPSSLTTHQTPTSIDQLLAHYAGMSGGDHHVIVTEFHPHPVVHHDGAVSVVGVPPVVDHVLMAA